MSAPGASLTRPPPALSERERESLRALHPVIERLRPRLDAAVEAVAAEIPVFATLLQSMDPSAREAQAVVSRRLERAAMLEGDWAPYANHLRELGAMYAHMGVAFQDWNALLRPYREVIEAEMLPASTPAERAVLAGMHVFLDRAIGALAEAYVDTKEDLVRKAEAQLGLYEQLFRDSPIGKLIYEWESPPDLASFRLVTANAQAVALTGARVLERLDQTLADTGDGAESALAQRLANAIEAGEPQRWTVWRTGDGGDRVLDCHCFAMGASTGGLLVQDVTEQRRTAEALARHARDLERSNKELDDFAYVASHDLKAPLRDIDSLATWIEEDAMELLPEGSKRHLGTIRDRIGRMERLLDDLLQYSRAGRIAHQPEVLELRRVIAEVLLVVAPPPGFEVVVSGDAPPLRAPRVPLELVLRNLVANAIKHHHRDAGRIEIGIAPESDRVVLTVSDDGPGIAPEFHERVFRMFQTLRPRDEIEGSGMGLAIVKKIIEAHDGSVRLESSPGSGTTFRFTWPREWRSGAA